MHKTKMKMKTKSKADHKPIRLPEDTRYRGYYKSNAGKYSLTFCSGPGKYEHLGSANEADVLDELRRIKAEREAGESGAEAEDRDRQLATHPGQARAAVLVAAAKADQAIAEVVEEKLAEALDERNEQPAEKESVGVDPAIVPFAFVTDEELMAEVLRRCEDKEPPSVAGVTRAKFAGCVLIYKSVTKHAAHPAGGVCCYPGDDAEHLVVLGPTEADQANCEGCLKSETYAGIRFALGALKAAK